MLPLTNSLQLEDGYGAEIGLIICSKIFYERTAGSLDGENGY